MAALLIPAAVLVAGALAVPVGPPTFKLFGQIIDPTGAGLIPVTHAHSQGASSSGLAASAGAHIPAPLQGAEAEPAVKPGRARLSLKGAQARQRAESSSTHDTLKEAASLTPLTSAPHAPHLSAPPTSESGNVPGEASHVAPLGHKAALAELIRVRTELVQSAYSASFARGETSSSSSRGARYRNASRYGSNVPPLLAMRWTNRLSKGAKRVQMARQNPQLGAAWVRSVENEHERVVSAIERCRVHAKAWTAQRRAVEAIQDERNRIAALSPDDASRMPAIERLTKHERDTEQATGDLERHIGPRHLKLWDGLGRPTSPWRPS